MKLLRPGGSLVYSTCTMAMPQNDGVVQAALENLWQTTNIDMLVVDTSNIVDLFSETFEFYPKCRFGQMAVPNLTANYGPLYFCALRRLK